MKLKFYRIDNGKTQKEVAAYLGIAESTYSLYENEKRKIGFEDLLKLGELYGCTVDELLNSKTAATQTDDGLSQNQKRLIQLVSSLDDDLCAYLIQKAQDLIDFQQFRDARQ